MSNFIYQLIERNVQLNQYILPSDLTAEEFDLEKIRRFIRTQSVDFIQSKAIIHLFLPRQFSAFSVYKLTLCANPGSSEVPGIILGPKARACISWPSPGPLPAAFSVLNCAICASALASASLNLTTSSSLCRSGCTGFIGTGFVVGCGGRTSSSSSTLISISAGKGEGEP